MRYARDDVELRGTTIRKGDAVTAWLGSANRDEDVFEEAFKFDVSRRPNQHIAFGVGVHMCIGAPAARLALRVFFSELCRLVERIEPAGDAQPLVSNFVTGLKHLPVWMIPR